MKNRRSFLLGGSLLAAGAIGATAYHKTLRFPRIGFEPQALASTIRNNGAEFKLVELMNISTGENTFRAIAPEPKLQLSVKRGQHEVVINNIATNALLRVSGEGVRNFEESISGITRTVYLDAATDQVLELEWHIPSEGHSSFAVIGDTGGNTELDWCLQRAAELGAQFLLHLGDFNYGQDDYERAIKQFHQAPLPCYVSIGNHDFNDSGLVYHHFLSQLGPFNHAFQFAGTRFINFDTAADFLPPNGGLRGELFNRLIESPTAHQVFFTHRPLRDPRPGKHHIVSGLNEDKWLRKMIDETGGGTLLTGHVHHSAELNLDGVKQYTVGEGLGHEDILLQRPVAQLLMGHIVDKQPPAFEWADIQMPWRYHQSHTHLQKLEKRGDQRLINWYKSTVEGIAS